MTGTVTVGVSAEALRSRYEMRRGDIVTEINHLSRMLGEGAKYLGHNEHVYLLRRREELREELREEQQRVDAVNSAMRRYYDGVTAEGIRLDELPEQPEQPEQIEPRSERPQRKLRLRGEDDEAVSKSDAGHKGKRSQKGRQNRNRN